MITPGFYPIANVIAVLMGIGGVAQILGGILYRPHKSVFCNRCKAIVMVRKAGMRCPNGGHRAVRSHVGWLLAVLVGLLLLLAIAGVVAHASSPGPVAPTAMSAEPTPPRPPSASTTPAVESMNGAAQAAQAEYEAELQLNKIGKNSKRAYLENGQFVVGRAGPTPEIACCQDSTRHCPARPERWTGNTVWTELDFEIDEPAQAQYSYQSDGTSFIARAVEDPHCDGNTLTFEAVGRVVGGQPVITVSQLR
jgi:hypothetical protein